MAFSQPKTNPDQRGYGYAHRKARAQWASRHQPWHPCTRCGKPLGPMGSHLHLDHNEDRTGYLGFACGPCNRNAGAKNANRVSNGNRSKRKRGVVARPAKPTAPRDHT